MCGKFAHFKSISCFCDLDLDLHLQHNMLFSVHYLNNEHISPFKNRYVPSADFYEIRNTVTDEFSF